MPQQTHHYSNGEITIVWQPDKCIHSAKCVKGLGKVFNPSVKPWIDMSQADSDQIAHQVQQCPSGALRLGTTKEMP